MFRFSISDLGIFLGKSPVTIRAWERKGLLTLPRVGTNRALTSQQVLEVAVLAHHAGRISQDRLDLISDAIGAINVIEQEGS